MITLQEIFNDLAFGEFANLAIGNSNVKSIEVDEYPRIVSIINVAMYDLYCRFSLRTNEFKLHEKAGRNIYYLRSENVGNIQSGDPETYIEEDPQSPISGDIIKLIEAYDSDGSKVSIGDKGQDDGILILSQDTLKINTSEPLRVISIIYQASHPKIIITKDFNPKTYNLYFPGFIKQALLAAIASRYFIGKTGSINESTQMIANTFQAIYLRECRKIEEDSMVQTNIGNDTRFEDRGFV